GCPELACWTASIASARIALAIRVVSAEEVVVAWGASAAAMRVPWGQGKTRDFTGSIIVAHGWTAPHRRPRRMRPDAPRDDRRRGAAHHVPGRRAGQRTHPRRRAVPSLPGAGRRDRRRASRRVAPGRAHLA